MATVFCFNRKLERFDFSQPDHVLLDRRPGGVGSIRKLTIHSNDRPIEEGGECDTE